MTNLEKQFAYELRRLKHRVCCLSQNGANEILVGDDDLSGLAPAGYKMGVNQSNGNTYYVDDVGNWQLLNIGGSNTSEATYLISGDIIWNGGFSLSNTPLTYQILGITYTAPAGNLTINSADVTHPRYTVVYADINGNVGMIDGTPSTPADIPQVDAQTQIVLGVYYIPANSTQPEGLEKEQIYLENTEWTVGGTVGGIDANYLTNPFAGVKSVRLPQFTNNQYVSFVKGSLVDASIYTYLTFRIRLSGNASTMRLRLQWFNGVSLVSANAVDILNGDWGVNGSLANTWQLAVIPMALFNLNSNNVNTLRITQIGTSAVSTQLDNIEIQNGNGTPQLLSSFLPNSVPFGAANGQLTQQNPGLTYNPNTDTFNIGLNEGFSSQAILTINQGHFSMSASGYGTNLKLGLGNPADASKSLRLYNGLTELGRFWITNGTISPFIWRPKFSMFGDILPGADNDTELGDATHKLKKAWINEIETTNITAPASHVLELNNIPDSGGLFLGRANSGTTELEWVTAGSGSTTFTGLTDTPANYTGQGGKVVSVKTDETGVEFITIGAGITTFTGLTDTPANYTGAANKMVVVNSGATALEFITQPTPYSLPVATNTVLGGVKIGGSLQINSGVVDIADEVFDTKTINYSLVVGDKNKIIEMNLASANTVTINATDLNSLAIGSKIKIVQYGAGQTSFVTAGGAVILSATGATKIAARYGGAEIIKRSATEFYLIGDITT